MPVNANYIVTKRCPDSTSTNCVEWGGKDISCLGICTGDSLTTLEESIASKLCQVVSLTDASNIVIPDCFTAAWTNKDKEVLVFIDFLLTTACIQQNNITDIQTQLSTLNPLVTVDYKCCATNPCVTTGTVLLSVALQNIITCLCDAKSEIDTLKTQFSALVFLTQGLSDLVSNLSSQVETLTLNGASYQTQINSIKLVTDCLTPC